ILAKVVAWAPDRPTAVARLAQALQDYVLLGPRTNLSFLLDLVTHPAFLAGEVSTQFVEDQLATWQAPDPPLEAVALAAALLAQETHAPKPPSGTRAPDPWDRLAGARLP
ncbi:MAG: acetyl-CoA carboxylase biotin carboxylase subunit, partial [bacterium]